MIGYLKGEIIEINDNVVLINVNNVGFKVTLPSFDVYDEVEGSEMVLYTYLNVKEDALDLYGSKDKKVIEVFKRLIEVSGIGPKVAMGILSKLEVNDIICAIIEENVALISTCPGVGKKTAERLVLELKDKLTKQGFGLENNNSGKTTKISKNKDEEKQVKDEAYEALLNLGYKRSDAKNIIDKIYESGMTLDELIKKSLTR